MSVLSIRSRLTGIDNDAKSLIHQGIRNGQTVTMADAFEIDNYIRNIKRNDAWKSISFFRDFATVPNLNPVGGPRISFSRASSATRINQAGLIELVGTNTPRFDYDSTTHAGKGLLIEESRTNLTTYSQNIGYNDWTNRQITVTSSLISAPDGSLSVSKLQETSVSNFFDTFMAVTVVDATTYTLSVYAKAVERNWFRLSFVGVGTWFNLSDGTIGTVSSGQTASIVSVGNSWYRCVVTGVSTSTSMFVDIALADANNSISYQGVEGSGILTWGAQLEAGSFPTSYIPTTSATVTRAADLATITGNDFKAFYRQDEGALFCSYRKITNSFYSAGIGNDQDCFYVFDNGPSDIRLILRANTAGDFIFYAPTLAIGLENKVIFAYKQNDYGATANGTSSTSSNHPSILALATELRIGEDNFGIVNNGYISKIVYYSKRLSNSTLQSLTG